MKRIGYFVFILLILLACTGKSGKKQVIDGVNETNGRVDTSICITEGALAYSRPTSSGDILSKISLGERLCYRQISAEDSLNKGVEFYQVELSDETVVWVTSESIVLNAFPAAIINETPVYVRPDILSNTLGSFNPLEFVAVVSAKDAWVEIIGIDNSLRGWIEKKNISIEQEDISISVLANKSILVDGVVDTDQIGKFLENIPYKNSCFVPYLQALLDDEVGEAIENAIEEYERMENVMLE
jgi:hypothetical protein